MIEDVISVTSTVLVWHCKILKSRSRVRFTWVVLGKFFEELPHIQYDAITELGSYNCKYCVRMEVRNIYEKIRVILTVLYDSSRYLRMLLSNETSDCYNREGTDWKCSLISANANKIKNWHYLVFSLLSLLFANSHQAKHFFPSTKSGVQMYLPVISMYKMVRPISG